MTAPDAIPFDLRQTQFLIIGSGIAGLRAAIELAPHGSVVVVNKGRPYESATEYAQGGIAVVLDGEDSIQSHREDTMRAGKGLCSQEAVEVLVREGPIRIKELMEWGARFDREEGRYAFAREGGHSHARILRAGGDATGTEILKTLADRAKNFPSIVHLDNHFSMDLLVSDGICIGAVLLNETGSRLAFIKAGAVLMASGGAGQVYARTTNPPVATGDGMAMAYRAGASLSDMEFVQFHPTALSLPHAPPFLLTEAMRGEGATLINQRGEAFMGRYHPDRELAPRDVVARAIWQEMQTDRSDHVFLDMTHRNSTYLKTRFPTVYRTCLHYGIDIVQDRIPVSPSAHFMIGGIHTDSQGKTTLPGLFAAGEVAACGVHGANRLASNSLLEGLVFGTRAASDMAQLPSQRLPPDSVLTRMAEDYVHRLSSTRQGLTDIPMDSKGLSRVMWNNAGMVRTQSSLTEALESLSDRMGSPPPRAMEGKVIEHQNLITVARLIVRAALLREESRGVHYRADFPEESVEWHQRHTRLRTPDQVDYFNSVTRKV